MHQRSKQPEKSLIEHNIPTGPDPGQSLKHMEFVNVKLDLHKL